MSGEVAGDTGLRSLLTSAECSASGRIALTGPAFSTCRGCVHAAFLGIVRLLHLRKQMASNESVPVPYLRFPLIQRKHTFSFNSIRR